MPKKRKSQIYGVYIRIEGRFPMNYYSEIEVYIKKNEVSKKARVLEENQSTLENYWNIGRLLVEAQGGSERAKYGNGLIKEWSIKYTEKYGKGYDATNLKRFRKFFLCFPKGATLWHQLTWSQLREIILIEDENKRNYYINLCMTKKLSVRELIKEIKNNISERLINNPYKLVIIVPLKSSLLNQMKNPILIELEKEKAIQNEQDLETTILAKLQNFFSQLGEGFTLVDNQYKINYGNKKYYIDIFLFNYKLNCFVVVELKLRELKKEDKAQIEFYMKLIDEQVKESFHNKTIGIIISKKQDKLIANFVRSESVIPLTYEIKKR